MKGGKQKADTTKKADAKLSVKRKATEKASKPAKKGKVVKDKPKRPPSAFFVFMEEFRKQFKEKNPNNKQVSVVGKAAGAKWKSLSAAEKAPYEDKAAKLKAVYNKSMNAYNKQSDGGGKKKSVEEEEESDKSKSEINDEEEDEESGEDEAEDNDDDDE